ncbi:MAG: radical SAM family heme chaperone HemW [Balneolaceae bacterium]
MSGIYIHIPFCKQACSYCDFYFVTQQQHKQNFVDQLILEIKKRGEARFSEEPVRTIYFGGGTPSLLSVQQVESILGAIKETFTLDVQEITFEMNPDDVSREYLNGLKSAGINRASMGVQTFNPDLLNFMNRVHTSEEALECLQILRESDFNVFTVDLIYGNPGQSLETLEQDLNTILSFDPPHVSAYSLTIEPRTRLGVQVRLGQLVPPEDDTVSDHFDLVENMLGEAGVTQYEVSNFAKSGSEARHNTSYWTHENYLGLGPGAHSFWWDEGHQSAQRWSNKKHLKSYLSNDWKNSFDLETIQLSSLAEERLMLGLRTKSGVSESELMNRYGFEFSEKQESYLQKMEEEGKLNQDEQIHLTTKGLKIADAVLLDLLTAD